jgi:hypothetical protein
MHALMLRRVPWTCAWGRFGVAVTPVEAAVRPADVFWGCDHPRRGLEQRLARIGDCRSCPFWAPSARYAEPESVRSTM